MKSISHKALMEARLSIDGYEKVAIDARESMNKVIEYLGIERGPNINYDGLLNIFRDINKDINKSSASIEEAKIWLDISISNLK